MARWPEWFRRVGDGATNPRALDVGKKLLGYLAIRRQTPGVQTLTQRVTLDDGTVVEASFSGDQPQVTVAAIIAEQFHQPECTTQPHRKRHHGLVGLNDLVNQFKIGCTSDTDFVNRRPARQRRTGRCILRRILQHGVLTVPLPRPRHAGLLVDVSREGHDGLNQKLILYLTVQVVGVCKRVARAGVQEKTDGLQEGCLSNVAST